MKMLSKKPKEELPKPKQLFWKDVPHLHAEYLRIRMAYSQLVNILGTVYEANVLKTEGRDVEAKLRLKLMAEDIQGRK